MKIGILTFWWSEDNYGQLLQCYALQKYLRELGHDAYVIKYNHFTDITKAKIGQQIYKMLNPKNIIRFVKKRIIQKKSHFYNRKFNDFRKKYINFSEVEYLTLNELRNNPPRADIYIVGSDQVWNFRLKNLVTQKNAIHAYMLDFGLKETKRISYAASCCYTSLTSGYKDIIVPLLKKFDAISVRESDGICFCKDFGRNDAKVVLDPTFLLNANHYRELYQESNFIPPKNKYVFLYMINDNKSFDINKVYKWAKSKKLDVIYVTANSNTEKYDKQLFATIPQWLGLIDHAQYVITNSFHCCVFSIFFNKKFGVIQRTGTKTTQLMNSRMGHLFCMFNIQTRYIDDFNNIEKDYVISKESYIKLKQESVKYLLSALK